MTTETAVTAVSYKKGLDRLKHLAGRAVMHLVLIISSILVAFPFIWMVTRSLMTAEELKRSRFTLIPSTIQWSNYLEFWHAEPLFPRYFLNSAIMAFGVLILQLIVAMLAAYAFTFVNFPGRNVLFFVAISTLMIPVVITYIPSYIILSSMPMWLRVCWSILLGIAGMVAIWLILRFLDTIFSGLAGRERPWVAVLWRVVLVVGVGAV
ncbi:MAG: carbohydrate ABC transporter permease, partial [Anaerolineae bacterium]|nr:carbohydrate ABC transporter permease [Anaerolineae bacterium]